MVYLQSLSECNREQHINTKLLKNWENAVIFKRLKNLLKDDFSKPYFFPIPANYFVTKSYKQKDVTIHMEDWTCSTQACSYSNAASIFKISYLL